MELPCVILCFSFEDDYQRNNLRNQRLCRNKILQMREKKQTCGQCHPTQYWAVAHFSEFNSFFHHGHHGPVTHKCLRFSSLRGIRHIKERKWDFRGNLKIPQSELPNNQNPKFGPKIWIKPPIRFHHRIRISVKISLWIQNLGLTFTKSRRSVDLFTPSWSDCKDGAIFEKLRRKNATLYHFKRPCQ